jgi:hypothetical protein
MPAVRRFLVVLVLLGGCGGGSKASDGGGGAGGGGGGSGGGGPGGGGDAASASCDADSMITVAGVLTGTRTAPAASSSWATASNMGLVLSDANFGASGASFLAAWSFIFMGQPQPGSYTDATPGLTCVVTASQAPGEAGATNVIWQANKGMSGTPDQGNCALTLTQVTATLTQSSQTQYCAHGSVQATLPPKPGGAATGTVTLTASF